MRRFLKACGFLLCVLPGFAGRSTAQPTGTPAASPGGVSVRGKVTDAQNKDAVGQAEVALVGSQHRAYTEDDGTFVIERVPPGAYRHLRKGDTLARWGGEEFLILLPHTDIYGARVLAEKIHNAVALERFQIGNRNFTITLTFGLCQHQSGRTIEESIRFADIAL